jgi:uncharacterized protein YggE
MRSNQIGADSRQGGETMYRFWVARPALTARAVLLAGLALSLVLTGCAAYSAANQPRTISVTGTGTVHLPPDVVLITLGVQTRGKDIGNTVADNNRIAQAVMAVVREAGVAAEDIQTTYFNVSTQPSYDQFGNPTGDLSYWVDNTLQISLRNVAGLGDLLQKALNAGANSVQSVTYSVDDPEAALSDARTQAMSDARQQAEQLATGAGATLGTVYSMSESSSGGSPFPSVFDKGAAGGAGVPTTPGTLEFQIQVYVTYTLR